MQRSRSSVAWWVELCPSGAFDLSLLSLLSPLWPRDSAADYPCSPLLNLNSGKLVPLYMRACFKALLCFPGINNGIGRYMLAVSCRMIQTAEWLLEDLNDNGRQLNGCWRYCFQLFSPPALHRYWTACQSADELSQFPSRHFALNRCCKPLGFRMWLLNSSETLRKCRLKPHQSLPVKLSLIVTHSSVLVLREKSYSRLRKMFWNRCFCLACSSEQ